MLRFNLKQYKEAQRGHEPPEAFKHRLDKKDPYDLTRHPGDGKGYNRVTPGSQGINGENQDIASPEFGRKWTPEGPSYPTQRGNNLNDDKAINRNETPAGWDPDDPFSAENEGDNRSTEYGQGLSTDYGQGIHDDKEPSADSALGLHSTVGRMIDDNKRDRPTPFGDMKKNNHPFNASSHRSVFDRIRKHQ